MALEVVGGRALLFDDDSSAAFVNSGDALVEWNSLLIDRYDVRHLLASPLPPRKSYHVNMRESSSSPSGSSLERDLDKERYLDLAPSSNDQESNDCGIPNEGGKYHAVGFSYHDPKEREASSDTVVTGFLPPFPVPENLLHSLPLDEKQHQIISRTAAFVRKHGGQSEIILRVKQGDNPTFGFLMPSHRLHDYFRYLIDNPQVQSHTAPGALSLLGSVYASLEEEEEEPKKAVVPHPVCVLRNGKAPRSAKRNEASGPVRLMKLRTDRAVDDSEASEPPPDLKKVVEKIGEFVAKNGRESERTLVEQDIKLGIGRFSFLLPSNKYHSYYLEVLQKITALKSAGNRGRMEEPSSDSAEKFKPKAKDHRTAAISVDAAAAILRAARRGIKVPDLPRPPQPLPPPSPPVPGDHRELKKADRLRRARMFASMIRAGIRPSVTSDPQPQKHNPHDDHDETRRQRRRRCRSSSSDDDDGGGRADRKRSCRHARSSSSRREHGGHAAVQHRVPPSSDIVVSDDSRVSDVLRAKVRAMILEIM